MDAAPDTRCVPRVKDIRKEYVDGGVVDILVYDDLACGVPPSMRSADGGCSFRLDDCQELCTYGACSCKADDASCPAGRLVEGPAVIACDLGCIGGIGRRPDGLEPAPASRATTAVGDFLSKAAYLEAASVFAFERLAAALSRHGAPRALVEAAVSAAHDEVRHAATTGRLARRFGADVAALRIDPSAPEPSLLAIATDNAVEGCARETLGALVASWQACRAADEELSRTARTIARDEIRHASLAWAISSWITPRLAHAERLRVEAAFRGAVRALELEALEPDSDLVRVAGLPNRAQQLSMIRMLTATLWEKPLLS